jgi:hypothetical protein
MTKNNLEIIFDAVKTKSKIVNINNIKFNGLKFWQPIKKMLSEYDHIKVAKWKNINSKYYKSYMTLPEYTIDGHGSQIIIKRNHFLIQQVRIPKHEKPSLRKIIQISLNIGQFLGTSTYSYRNRHRICYKKSQLSNLETYLYKKDIEAISKQIPDELVASIIQYLKKV